MKINKIFAIATLAAACSLTACEDYEFNLDGSGSGGGGGVPKPNAFIVVDLDTFLLRSMGSLDLNYDLDGMPTEIGKWYIDYEDAKNLQLTYFDSSAGETSTGKFKVNGDGYISSISEVLTKTNKSGNYDIRTEETNEYRFSYDKSGHLTSYTLTSQVKWTDDIEEGTSSSTTGVTLTWQDNTLEGFKAEIKERGSNKTMTLTYDMVPGGANTACQPVPANELLFPDHLGQLIYGGLLGKWSDTFVTTMYSDYNDPQADPGWESYTFKYGTKRGKIDYVDSTVRTSDGRRLDTTDTFTYETYFNIF